MNPCPQKCGAYPLCLDSNADPCRESYRKKVASLKILNAEYREPQDWYEKYSKASVDFHSALKRDKGDKKTYQVSRRRTVQQT